MDQKHREIPCRLGELWGYPAVLEQVPGRGGRKGRREPLGDWAEGLKKPVICSPCLTRSPS